MAEENKFMTNHLGHQIPIEMVKPIDRDRDNLVNGLAKLAIEQSGALLAFKKIADQEISKFIQRSADKYEVSLGGAKGNLTLMSFDGEYKVQVAVAQHITFDERLQIAKKLIDECINGWTKGSRNELKILVDSAFDVDKQGNISKEKVLGLRKHDISDPKWKKAMEAISDSITISGSKSYIRFYQRQQDGSYNQILLDFASLLTA